MIDVIVLLFALFVMWYFGSCRVKFNHLAVLERGGAYLKPLKPGIQVFMPFLQRVRKVHWHNSALKLEGHNIPLQNLRFRGREVSTRGPNNGRVRAKFSITFAIVDVYKAVYEVENLYQYIEEEAAALLISALQKSLQMPKLIELFNSAMLDLTSIGVKVENLAIVNFQHRPPKSITNSPLQEHLEYARELQKEFPCSVTELSALIAALKA